MAAKFRIKKGDQVIVITGRDKGKKGRSAGSDACGVQSAGARREYGQAASPRNTE